MELLKKITELCESDKVYKAIELVQNQDIVFYPDKPSKPFLKNNHSSYDVLTYAKELELYEKANEVYKINKQKYDEIKGKIENHLIERMKDAAGLNTIPEQYRDKVYSYAWSEGHSSGFYEVYLKLNNIISTIFN